jgi:hypothetical protein
MESLADTVEAEIGENVDNGVSLADESSVGTSDAASTVPGSITIGRRGDKVPTLSKEWCGTCWPGSTGIHPFTRFPQLREFFDKQKPIVEQLCAGKEFGEANEGPHLQMYIRFGSTKKLADLRRLFPYVSNWQVRLPKSTAWRAAKYCLKGRKTHKQWNKTYEVGDGYGEFDESHRGYPNYTPDDFLLSLGVMPEPVVLGKKRGKQGSRTDIYDVQTQILAGVSLKTLQRDSKYCETIARCPNYFNRFALDNCKPYTHHHTKGIMLVGDYGVGKSQIIRDVFDPEGLGNSVLYLKKHNKWWNGYDNQAYVLMDELPIGHGFDINNLKFWADKHSDHAEEKHGHVNLVHKVFILTSNHSLQDLVTDFCKGKTEEYRDQLLGALLRRYEVFDYNDFTRVTVNSKLKEWKEFHDWTPEQQAEYTKSQRAKYQKRVYDIERLRVKGCPQNQAETVLKLESVIENQEGVQRRNAQRELDRLTSNWIYAPVMDLKSPPAPVLVGDENANPNVPIIPETIRFLTLEHMEQIGAQNLITPPSQPVVADQTSVNTAAQAEELLTGDDVEMSNLFLGECHDDASVMETSLNTDYTVEEYLAYQSLPDPDCTTAPQNVSVTLNLNRNKRRRVIN